MSKIRNSLGLLVLPVPSERMSLEEYKRRYAVDLNYIFEDYIDTGNVHRPKFRDITKIIAISLTKEIKDPVNGHLPSVIIPNEVASYSGSLAFKYSCEDLEYVLSLSIDWIDDHYEVTGEFA